MQFQTSIRLCAASLLITFCGPECLLAQTFVEVSSGVPPAVGASTVGWADYDLDGDLDLLIAGDTGSASTATLLRCQGGSFSDSGLSLPAFQNGTAAWGDYDRDGDLDLLVSGTTPTGRSTKLLRNTGGELVDSGVVLPSVSFSSAAWGDADNDGGLDLVLTGSTGSGYITHIYTQSNGSFSLAQSLTGVYSGSVAWGDCDADGDLDLAVTGAASGGRQTSIYRNTDGSFLDIPTTIPGVAQSSVAWGDLDQDGDLDLCVAGDTGTAGRICHVYTNAAGLFPSLGSHLPGVSTSHVPWGDFDNDGDSDLLLTGHTGSTALSGLCRNISAVFQDAGIAVPGIFYGSCAWGDYDADGDLDFAISGNTGTGTTRTGKIYSSSGLPSNTPPTAPGSLSATRSGSSITFAWSSSSDDRTPSPSLSYALRVGTSPGSSDVVASHSLSDGRRLLPASGPVAGTSWTLRNADPGKPYYWSVQAIDGSFSGSAFAPEQLVGMADATGWMLYE